jgi:hypothetical protein
MPGRKHKPLWNERTSTNVLDALWCWLLLVEGDCNQLENKIRNHHFDDAAYVAQRIVRILLTGSKAYRRIAAGLRGTNAPISPLIPIKNRMNAARLTVIDLLECARAEQIEPKTRQLMDNLQIIINTSGVCL